MLNLIFDGNFSNNNVGKEISLFTFENVLGIFNNEFYSYRVITYSVRLRNEIK